jgi:hypothetical protein
LAVCSAGLAFGIVTEFVMQAYSQPDLVLNGAMIFGRKDLKTPWKVANKIMEERNGDGRAAMDFAWGIPRGSEDGEVRTIALVFYNGSEADAKSFFAPLLDPKPDVITTTMKLFAEASIPGVSRPGDWRKCGAGGLCTALFDVAFFEELRDEFELFVKEVKDADASILA